MGLLNTSGIIIKQINYGEADKILTILTKNNGKIQAIAKGSRKTKNRFLASTQLFCYSDFIIYQGTSMAHINQAELRESFYNLRMNLEKLSYASYTIELINAATLEHQKEEKLFLLLIHTLKHMAYSKDIDLNIIVIAFQIKLMALLGFAPHMESCVSCGCALQENRKMSSKMGGFICQQCYKFDPYAMLISNEGSNALLFMLHQPLSSLNKLMLQERILKQLKRITNVYVSTYLEKAFYSLDFLNIIEKEGNMNKGDERNG